MRAISVARSAVIVFAFAAASCGGGGSSSYSPSPTPTPTPTPSAGQINIVGVAGNRSFNPNPSSLTADRMTTWTNTDGVIHRIVANDGSWDTGNIAPGSSSAAVQLPAGGTNYHCSIHPTMIGAVNDTSGNTPPCIGSYC
jgi:plastocyanin